MKLKINKNMLKKGFYLTGLSLVCMSISGCVKNDMEDRPVIVDGFSSEDLSTDEYKYKNINNFVNLYDYDENTRQSIEKADDTQRVLDAYNSKLDNQVITINDLEYMTQFNWSFAIKNVNGTQRTISVDSTYISLNPNGELIMYSDWAFTNDETFNFLTGEMIQSSSLKNDYNRISVGDYIKDNNIKFSAYALPELRGWSDHQKEAIIEKYGEEVLYRCVREYGIPLKMYEAKDFYNIHNVKTIEKSVDESVKTLCKIINPGK